MKWLKQLIGKLKSIGGRKQAKDTTASAPAESVEKAPTATVVPDDKAEAAEEAATEKAKSAAADAATTEAETVAATEEAADETEPADAEPVAEKAEPAEPVAEETEPETVAAEEPEAPAEQAAEADSAETVAATEDTAEDTTEPEDTAEPDDTAKPEGTDKPAPAGPALSTLDEGAITAELTAGGPYGPGSAKPAADGSAPSAEFAVKAKESSKLFHTEKSPYFGRTKADVWFKSEADAESAGFQAWDHKKRAAAKK